MPPTIATRKHVEALSADLGLTSTETTAANAKTFTPTNQEPGRLWAIEIHGTTLSGAATITIRAFRDAACDQEIFPATSASMSLGKTAPTKWSATFLLDIVIPGNTVIYLVAKTDAGTATITGADTKLVWEE